MIVDQVHLLSLKHCVHKKGEEMAYFVYSFQMEISRKSVWCSKDRIGSCSLAEDDKIEAIDGTATSHQIPIQLLLPRTYT